jgi:hypothetical protein
MGNRRPGITGRVFVGGKLNELWKGIYKWEARKESKSWISFYMGSVALAFVLVYREESGRPTVWFYYKPL